MSPAQKEAQEINNLIPNPYVKGQYYTVNYNGHEFKAARKWGAGKNAGKYYLHILRPCTVVLKTPEGEVLDRRPGQRHYMIELFNDTATWKEV